MVFLSLLGIVQVDMMKVYLEVHYFMKFEKSLNATFIALILKKAGALEMRDFKLLVWLMGWTRLYPRC